MLTEKSRSGLAKGGHIASIVMLAAYLIIVGYVFWAANRDQMFPKTLFDERNNGLWRQYYPAKTLLTLAFGLLVGAFVASGFSAAHLKRMQASRVMLFALLLLVFHMIFVFRLID